MLGISRRTLHRRLVELGISDAAAEEDGD
jgi:transcriptional regulator of acetoin/glycerol metabolism